MGTLEGYTVKDLYFQSNFIYSDFDNAKLDFDYYLTDSSSLKFGANYKKFSNTGFERVAQNFPTNLDTPQNQGVFSLTAEQAQLFNGHPDRGWLQGDMAALQAFYGLTDFTLTDKYTVESSAYDLTEETHAAYVVYDTEYDVAGAPLRLNLGVRYFNTEITSTGLSKGVPTKLVRTTLIICPA